MSEWLTEFAKLLHAKPPKRIPVWLGRLFIGDSGVYLMTRTRGAANARAKRILNWNPTWPDWQKGFAATLGIAP
jgi:hypothetical protein